MARASAIAGLLVVVVAASPAGAAAWLVPPVDGTVGRSFEAPSGIWGPGHRGIDLTVPAGTWVRAAGAGIVTFAGDVAGTVAVTIHHGGGLESTYSRLAEVSVIQGERVETGTWLGTVGEAHPEVDGLHFGIKLNGSYVDPAQLLGPLDPTDAIHLAPLQWRYSDVIPEFFGPVYDTAGSNERECQTAGSTPPATPPNSNIAVAVAGIGSRTYPKVDAAMYEPGPRALGYPHDRTYNFSYRGTDGPRFHEPYARSDTFGDLRVAAIELKAMLERIHAEHPAAAIDLIAHSQGGIVARTYLQEVAETWDRDLPVIEHVVTFSSPHGGADIAEAGRLIDDSLPGKAALHVASYWANNGGPLPDPYAASVAQLTPGSGLLDDLAREDVLFGTRALSLGIPNDVIVTADRARWPRQASAVVAPQGFNGHDAIVTSDAARAIAHAFLRDGAPTCAGTWDTWGSRVGAVIGWTERALARLLP